MEKMNKTRIIVKLESGNKIGRFKYDKMNK